MIIILALVVIVGAAIYFGAQNEAAPPAEPTAATPATSPPAATPPAATPPANQ
jgi:hypothetical protein